MLEIICPSCGSITNSHPNGDGYVNHTCNVCKNVFFKVKNNQIYHYNIKINLNENNYFLFSTKLLDAITILRNEFMEKITIINCFIEPDNLDSKWFHEITNKLLTLKEFS